MPGLPNEPYATRSSKRTGFRTCSGRVQVLVLLLLRERRRVEVELGEPLAVRPVGPAGLAVAPLRRQRSDQVEVGRLVVGVDVEDAQPQPDGFAVVARVVGEPPELAGGLDERVAGQLTRARPPSRRTGRRRRSRPGSAPRPGPAGRFPSRCRRRPGGGGPSAASRRNCSTSTSTCSRTSHTVSWSAATYRSGGNDFCGSRTLRIVLSRTDSRRAERSDSSGHSRLATSSRTTGAPRLATSSLTKSRALREPHSLISIGTPLSRHAEAAERRDGDRRRTGRAGRHRAAYVGEVAPRTRVEEQRLGSRQQLRAGRPARRSPPAAGRRGPRRSGCRARATADRPPRPAPPTVAAGSRPGAAGPRRRPGGRDARAPASAPPRPGGRRRTVPAAQLHPATGQQRVRLRHGLVGFDRPLGERSGPMRGRRP